MEVHRPTVSFTLSLHLSFGHRITIFQEENVGTTFIYFKLFISKNPSTRKIDSPPLMSQYGKFRDSPVKSEAPWGQVHSRKCSKDVDRQYHPAPIIAVQGPSFVHCRWHQDVPWLSVLFPAPGCLPLQYLIHVVYYSLVLYLLCY